MAQTGRARRVAGLTAALVTVLALGGAFDVALTTADEDAECVITASGWQCPDDEWSASSGPDGSWGGTEPDGWTTAGAGDDPEDVADRDEDGGDTVQADRDEDAGDLGSDRDGASDREGDAARDDGDWGGDATTRCASRRSFRIRITRVRGKQVVAARVYVNGRRVTVRRGRWLTAPVRLAGLPRGTYTVRIRARTRSGGTVTATRRYRTCTRGESRTGRG